MLASTPYPTIHQTSSNFVKLHQTSNQTINFLPLTSTYISVNQTLQHSNPLPFLPPSSLTRHFGMPPKSVPMSDTCSSNARAYSAPASHNTNRASYVGNANIWNQPQLVTPASRGPPQTTPPSSLMGPPTMIPPSVTGQTQGRSGIQARFDEIYFTSPLPRVSILCIFPYVLVQYLFLYKRSKLEL